jgi:hypothetical protein
MKVEENSGGRLRWNGFFYHGWERITRNTRMGKGWERIGTGGWDDYEINGEFAHRN